MAETVKMMLQARRSKGLQAFLSTWGLGLALAFSPPRLEVEFDLVRRSCAFGDLAENLDQ